MADSEEAFQATQVDGDDDEWSEAGSSQPTQGDHEGVWGRLVNLGGGDPELLVENDEPGQRGEFNEHVLGRNVDLSSIIVDFDRRISGKHCRVFCEAAVTPPSFDGGAAASSSAASIPAATYREQFHVYVQNLSSNGTFVNNIKLKDKGERRLLHNGDEIALLKPKDNQPNKGSFTFVNLRQRNLNASAQGVLNNLSTGPLAGPATPKTAAPHYLGPAVGDDDQRNVHDYYTFTNQSLGEGQYGKVSRVVERATGIHWACKEVDAKKAYLQGHTKEQLLSEFNIMKKIDTPFVIKTKEYFNTADGKLLFILELIEGVCTRMHGLSIIRVCVCTCACAWTSTLRAGWCEH
mmetsp:Transcript_68523/g.190553  ORF Transcript_68523/g.190553 Transcript_68523/m.190553 type:complete len:349 (-) Transcript_68523:1314-2360(-)